MRRENAQNNVESTPLIDEDARPGTVTRTLFLGFSLIAAAAIFVLFQDWLGEPVFLSVLGMLAVIGVFFLFASAIGFVQTTPRSIGDALSKAYLDQNRNGILITADGDNILYANRAYGNLTDAAQASDVQSIDLLLSKDSQNPELAHEMKNALSQGQTSQSELRIVPASTYGKTSPPRWYKVNAGQLSAPGVDVNHTVWQLTDISDEKLEQERFFKDLQQAIDHLDHAPTGFFAADSDGRITYLNATFAEWIGIDLMGFAPGTIHLSDFLSGDSISMLQTVKAELGGHKSAAIDLDLIKKTGEVFPARLFHRVASNASDGSHSSRTIVVNNLEGDGTISDLKAAEVRFTRFFNSTPMAIASVDTKGRILRNNAPFLSLFGDVVGADAIERHIKIDEIIEDNQKAAFHNALDAAARKQANIEPIDTVLPTDFSRHLRFYVNAVADPSGENVEEAAIVYAVETTEQKALEAQMAQSQKMQAVGQLAGGIAHDFNNVLTAIIMSSDLLLANQRPSDPSFPDIMNIKQNANRAASLVRQLLAFSRRQTLRPEVLNLTDVLADLRMLLARLAGNEVELKIEHGRDLWLTKADIGQFEQVIVNLTVNARDAMPGGGELIVRTSNITRDECVNLPYRELQAADYVMVEVIDDGSGIEPDVLEKIFEPFFTTKEVGKGTGLGLSMVYGIIKQTNGFIFADSKLDEGTTFKIFLPRHEEQVDEVEQQQAVADSAKPVEEAAAPKPSQDLSGSATVLLVEDEDAVRMGGLRALQSRGYTVHEAASGVEALEVFEQLEGAVDIVVSDVVMPEMDGPTLLRELRKQQPDIKFIFVSGYAEEAFAKNLPEDAQFGFLAKPFSLKQLAMSVKDMLESD